MAQQSKKNARSLYHRWRSSSFAEVVAQEHVTRTLRNAVARGRIVHAYLFCGPRGTGKTSTARILAKAVNCLDPQDGEPCNRCTSCVAMNEGRAIDLIEIDAASNRGIDDARELRDKIKFAPGESRFKVYIIDEAHMLTSEASNALLKTLEEPPDHAILILATTEAHKILPTILSRCQHFDFRRIPLQAIVSQLEMICEAEGLSPGKGVLERVARMGRGSLRDAESLLDQLVAYCGDQIELDATREVLGLTGEECVPDFARALRTSDLVEGFRLIDTLSATGADLRHFSRELVDYLRALVVAKSGAATSLAEEYRADELSNLTATAEGWSFHQLLRSMKAFGDVDGKLKQEAFGQIQLEMALLEVALPEEADQPGRTSQQHSAVVTSTAPDSPSAASPSKTPGSAADAGQATVEPEEPKADERQPDVRDAPREGAVPQFQPDVLPLDLATAQSQWRRAVSQIGASGATRIAVALEGAHPVKVVGNTVIIGVDDKRLWRSSLEAPGAAGKVAAVLGNLFGAKVAVRFEYGAKIHREPVSPDQDAVVEAAVREFGFKIARVDSASDTR
jgi:DNA polymerase III subunit gamma/tau